MKKIIEKISIALIKLGLKGLQGLKYRIADGDCTWVIRCFAPRHAAKAHKTAQTGPNFAASVAAEDEYQIILSDIKSDTI